MYTVLHNLNELFFCRVASYGIFSIHDAVLVSMNFGMHALKMTLSGRGSTWGVSCMVMHVLLRLELELLMMSTAEGLL